MLDDGVGVVGPACEDDHHAPLFFRFCHDFGGFGVQLFLIFLLCGYGCVNGLVGHGFADSQGLEVFHAAFAQEILVVHGDNGLVGGDPEALLRVDGVAHYVGIAGHDGTVVAVSGMTVVRVFHDDEGVEDAIDFLSRQVEHVPVHQRKSACQKG